MRITAKTEQPAECSCKKIIHSRWLDVALTVSFLLLAGFGMLLSLGVFNFLSRMTAYQLANGMYGAAAVVAISHAILYLIKNCD